MPPPTIPPPATGVERPQDLRELRLVSGRAEGEAEVGAVVAILPRVGVRAEVVGVGAGQGRPSLEVVRLSRTS